MGWAGLVRYDIRRFLAHGWGSLAIAGLAAAMLGVALIFVNMLPFGADWFGNMLFSTTVLTLLGGVVIIAYAMDSLLGEAERNTLLLLAAAPVGRRGLFTGKLLGSLLVVSLLVAILIPFSVGSMIYFGPIGMIYFVLYHGNAWLYLFAWMGVAYFLSSILRGRVAATVLVFAMYMFGEFMSGLLLSSYIASGDTFYLPFVPRLAFHINAYTLTMTGSMHWLASASLASWGIIGTLGGWIWFRQVSL